MSETPPPDREYLIEASRARARADRLAAEVAALREENDRLKEKIAAIYASETFRLGERLLRVPRRLLLRARGRVRSRGDAASTVVVAPPEPEVVFRLASPVADVPGLQPSSVRGTYQQLLERPHGTRQWAIAVSDTDLDSGRGDLYVALGMARALRRHGVDVVLLRPGEWTAPPDDVELVIAMVCEPALQFDPLALPAGVPVAAWVRNNVDRWLARGDLRAYDAVFASSPRTAERLTGRCSGPVEVLPIAVDLDLFDSAGRREDADLVVSTVSQWGAGSPRRLFPMLLEAPLQAPLALFGVHRGIDERLAAWSHGKVDYFVLPDVYRRAGVVLDEPQASNQRDGNVNARVFESIACGAVPVTTSDRGLSDLGLDDVPVAGDAQQLADVVERVLAPEVHDDLAARLGAVVRERHSTDVRARQLLDAVEAAGLMRSEGGGPGPGPRERTTVLGFSPDYRVTNPYQDLLYAALPDDVVVHPGVGPADTLRAAARLAGPAVHHQHWTATIIGPASSAADARARVDQYLADVDRLRGAGGHLVWTLHNAMPHEARFVDEERRLRRGLAERASAIHVMCETTPELVAEQYALPPERIHVIPHGSFLGVYPDVIEDSDARAELGIGADELVVGHLGQIRPYKGLGELLDAWEQERQPGWRLLVAGAVGRFREARALAARVQGTPGVLSVLEAVPDEDLQRYVRACDVLVLPHRQALNSGVIPLAHTFGRPVVAPDIGCLPSQVGADGGVVYPPGDVAGALRAVPRLVGIEHRRRAFARARAWTARDMGRAFAALVDEVLACTAP